MTAPTSDLTLTLVGDCELRISRTFRAPRALVFQAMTQPDHLTHWWGPSSHTMTACAVDFQVGGRYRYVLRSPEGVEAGFGGEFREIAAPERVVQTFEYEPVPDFQAVETLTWQAAGPGSTRLTILTLYQNPEHRAGILASGMEPTLADSYARLDAYLAGLA